MQLWLRLRDSMMTRFGSFVGGYWWLAHFCTFLHLQLFANQLLAKFCSARQIPNGTKTGQNHRKIKSRTLQARHPPCRGLLFSVQRFHFCPVKNKQNPANMLPIKHLYYMCIFRKILQVLSCTDLCCLLQRPVKIRFMPFVHYGIAADAHCLGTVYNPSAIICNAEICVPSANW